MDANFLKASIKSGPGVYKRADGSSGSRLTGLSLLILIGVAVVLKVGHEIFVPLALSLLLSFTLAPIVSFLRKRHIPKIAAVIVAVASAFCAIAIFSFIVATQVANLAENVPVYQRNIVEKVRSLSQAGTNNSVLEHLSKAAERVGAEIQSRAAESQEPAVESPPKPEPLPVEIVSRNNPLETLLELIVPLIAPFATAGLVIVLVVFILLEREDLRDRFIRLVGINDLHRTTTALQDAGKRVGKYLLMQLVVNGLYAVPITLGLWVLGIPNAILWGLLTLVLRFVPYIGPVIGMILPLFLALAISPGWGLVLWVAGLFLVTELISNNVIEPWLYGSHTGLSPLAIIVSAIFWSWLWGPLGLMLSTPLTVCLVVLGRHVPQFAFLDILLGNEPVLEPQDKLYQRLLAGDPSEATDNAEEFLSEDYLIDYYEKVGLPALLLGEQDRQRGVMSEDQMERFVASTRALVDNLADIADEEEQEDDEAAAEPASDATGVLTPELPDGRGRNVLCFGGRGPLDDAASVMLAQLLDIQGADASNEDHTGIDTGALRTRIASGPDTVIVSFLNGNSKAHARYIVRRMKRIRPDLRVGVLMPLANGQDKPKVDAEEINADFVALTFTDAIRAALTDTKPVDLKVAVRKPVRSRFQLNLANSA